MKQNRFIRKCGPYKVSSISQDMHGVRLEIYPAFPQYNLTGKEQSKNDIDTSWTKEPRWSIHRYKGEGGGPGIFTAMALASEFEEFLNQFYSEEAISEWKSTLDKALKKIKVSRRQQER